MDQRERVRIISDRQQEFLGVIYSLATDGRYYERGPIRLHQVVWIHHNGPIPPGHEVHHVDKNRGNNQIENLNAMPCSDHRGLHAREPERIEKSRANLEVARVAAAQWHQSPEGRERHRRIYEAGGGQAMHAKRYHHACAYCGSEFDSNRAESVQFCSNKCKSAERRRSGVDDETRACAHCGAPFTRNKYLKRLFCSGSCSQRHRRAGGGA